MIHSFIHIIQVILIKGIILFFSYGLFAQDSLVINYNIPGGIYKNGLSVELSTSANATIYYTLDGSEPNRKSTIYSKAISLDTTTIIRCYAKTNALQSVIYTQSYLIENRDFNFPVISIAIDAYDFLDPIKGLYSKGLNAAENPPYRGANYHKDKELPIHIEYFDTNGNLGFSQLAGLKIYGAYSRMFPQKSLAIISRTDYGDRNFDYPIFPDLPFKKYKSFILRNSGTDNNKSHFRDVMMTQLVKDLSFDIQSYRTCVVYINGKYWGIYHIREKLNEHFLKQHYDLEKDSVTIMKHRTDLKIGKRLNYNRILSFIKKTNFSNDEHIDSLDNLIDVNNFLDYNIAQTYFANTDAGGNIRFWRSWNDTSRWKWLMFDTDFGFGLDGSNSYKKNTIIDFTKVSNERWPYPAWSTLFIRKLLQNDSIRGVYINKTSHFLNTIFDTALVENKRQYFVDMMEKEIDFHHKRWGSSRSNWEGHIKRIKDFGKKRPYYIRKYLEEYFYLDSSYRININPHPHGSIYLNTYLIDSNFSGNYYNSVKQTIVAKPNQCYIFDKWVNRKDTSSSITMFLSQNESFTPIFKKKPNSEHYHNILFSEFSLKGGEDVGDWVELVNTSSDTIDLSNWFIKREDDKNYIIPYGTILSPNSYLVISRFKALVDSLYTIKSLDGLYSLKDTSTLVLYDNYERLVDSVTFNVDGKEHLDLNSFEGDWIANKKYTPGALNGSQIEKQQLLFFIHYILYPFLGLFFLILTIFLIKRLKRPHSSTE